MTTASSLEEVARKRAKKAIDAFVKDKKFPIPRIILLAMKPFLPALREVWINGWLDGLGFGASETSQEVFEKMKGFYEKKS